MNYIQTAIPDCWIIEPKVFNDTRGYFMEVYKQSEFEANIGKVSFVQDNESSSTKGVLRGLHYQMAPYSQAKLVRVIQGTVLDVAVDLRVGSPTFGKSIQVELSSDNKKQLYIPQGFAHGFCVLSEQAVFTYKVDNPYTPTHERSLRYNDPTIGIDWKKISAIDAFVLSQKDKNAPFLSEAQNNFTYK